MTILRTLPLIALATVVCPAMAVPVKPVGLSGFRDMHVETSPLSGQTTVHLTITAQDLEAQPKAIKDVLVHLRILDKDTGQVIKGCGKEEEEEEKGGTVVRVRIRNLVIGGISAPRTAHVSSNHDQGFINRGNINMPLAPR